MSFGFVFFFQAEDGIRDLVRSRGLGDVYKRQLCIPRMKRLHRMIIGVYWGPLLVTFLIVLFLFSMQWLWKWVDDLMGKGLPWDVLTKLIAFATSAFAVSYTHLTLPTSDLV